ncbi:PREDICTED: LOW QUALITY PROTEIN: transcription termination factor 2-like, partial [Polistes canadensis]|uniref:LOW QUALITY PROTEIN: transcription termination factor 2-like n=1 Tax=Polistes canadensis TaxID=91411 RepID=UPI000718D52C
SKSKYVYTEPVKSAKTIDSKKLDKIAEEILDHKFTLTAERLQDLHELLVAQPSEDTKAEYPPGLKVKLMPHQQHALAWLMWRERERPLGGVLADDMGLGKNLTMISLIVATPNQDYLKSDDETESNDEWINPNKPISVKYICLLIVIKSIKFPNMINLRNHELHILVCFGNKREKVSNRLAKYDVVITTYNILSSKFEAMSTTYKIHLKRIILNEAHCIRNHDSQASQASQAVCGLLANKRWTRTETPIQNKKMDLYSLLKFLKCSPFDDIRVWKRWVNNKNVAGHQRLATLMKSLMLRRTKQELQAQGALESLPNKNIKE